MLLKTLLLGLYRSPMLDSFAFVFLTSRGLSVCEGSYAGDIFGRLGESLLALRFSCLMLAVWFCTAEVRPGGEFLIVIFGSFLEPCIRGTKPISILVLSIFACCKCAPSSNIG